MIDNSLESLRAELEALGRPVVDLWISGVDGGTVVEKLGGNVPADVVAWFRWCGGVRLMPGQIQDDVNLIPGYEPLGLEEAVSSKEEFGAMDAILGDSWIPLLQGGADFYAAVYGHAKGNFIVSVMPESGVVAVYEDVVQMVEAFTECYKRGAFFVDSDGMLDMDFDIWEAVDRDFPFRLRGEL
ncbi:hypothetical protein RB196_24120 [Streptomyces sp. PmtA]|uniref:hypothetical protein n=1 Tax=Streptomyces sp. PmtA TaxID=3074275 RepID=UPI003014D106